MEVSKLSAEVKYLGTNGITLNIEERANLELSCAQLASDIGADKIWFWGKIRGKWIFMHSLAKVSAGRVIAVLLAVMELEFKL